jgi:ADP-heptose:LPS heptosyltransferase
MSATEISSKKAKAVKVLVVRFSSMGDILLTTPVLRAVHDLLEGEVELHFLTKAEFAPLVEGLEAVQKVHVIQRTTAEVQAALVAEGFHYLLDLHSNARSAFIRRALRKDGTVDFVVDKRNVAKWKLVRGLSNELAGEPIVDRYLKTLAAFGGAQWDDGCGLDLPPLLNVENSTGTLRDLGSGPFVALALGAAHKGKAVPLEHWVEVITRLHAAGRSVVLLGGPEDRTMGEEISTRCSGEGEERLVNLAGHLRLLESFSVLSKASVLVAGDTGLMHAGAAAGVPMAVVWGCTAPALGMGPYRPGAKVVELEPQGRKQVGGARRPCSKLGNRCRYNTPCIETVSPDQIADAVLALS